MNINHEDRTITISQNTGITVSIALLLLIFGSIIGATTWVANTQTQIESLNKIAAENTSHITQLENDTNNSKIKYAEIQTQLKSIDATLIEIKQAIK